MFAKSGKIVTDCQTWIVSIANDQKNIKNKILMARVRIC